MVVVLVLSDLLAPPVRILWFVLAVLVSDNVTDVVYVCKVFVVAFLVMLAVIVLLSLSPHPLFVLLIVPITDIVISVDVIVFLDMLELIVLLPLELFVHGVVLVVGYVILDPASVILDLRVSPAKLRKNAILPVKNMVFAGKVAVYVLQAIMALIVDKLFLEKMSNKI